MTEALTPIDPASVYVRELQGPEELPAIVRMYDLAGWGPVSAEWLESWLFQGRLGPAIIAVAVHAPTEEVVGMLLYLPSRVYAFGEEQIACRSRAAVLDPRLRRAARGEERVTEDDPMQRISNLGRELRIARGWELSYALPNPKMVRRNELKVEPPKRKKSEVTLGYGLKVELEQITASKAAAARIRAVNADEGIEEPFGDEYDDLWARGCAGLPIRCAVVRDRQALAGGRSRWLRLELRRPGSGALRGYMLLRDQREAKLEDVFAEDAEAMSEVLEAGFAWLRHESDRHGIEFFSSLPHPVYADRVRELGGRENDWLFTFSVHSPHDLDDPRPLGPEYDAANWYVTTGD